MQQPSEYDTPFSLPHDTPTLTPLDYPDYDGGVDLQEAYDEGMDDTVDANPYEYDDDPIRSAKKAMQRGMGTIEKVTTDHDTIKKWAEDRGGHPYHIKGVADGLDRGGLYIAFDGTEPDIDIEPISWEQFFKIFKTNRLAFLYRKKTRTGNTSYFYIIKHQNRENKLIY